MKNFFVHKDMGPTNGTCLQDYVYTSYKSLVDLFGPPHSGDGYKVDAEWVIESDTGVVATIYNWKDGYNYNGHAGRPVDTINEWHIGGHNKDAVTLVVGALNGEYDRRPHGDTVQEARPHPALDLLLESLLGEDVRVIDVNGTRALNELDWDGDNWACGWDLRFGSNNVARITPPTSPAVSVYWTIELK